MDWGRFNQTDECAPRARPSRRAAGVIVGLRRGDFMARPLLRRRSCDRGRRMKVAA
jgi:hypothetical protein